MSKTRLSENRSDRRRNRKTDREYDIKIADNSRNFKIHSKLTGICRNRCQLLQDRAVLQVPVTDSSVTR